MSSRESHRPSRIVAPPAPVPAAPAVARVLPAPRLPAPATGAERFRRLLGPAPDGPSATAPAGPAEPRPAASPRATRREGASASPPAAGAPATEPARAGSDARDAATRARAPDAPAAAAGASGVWPHFIREGDAPDPGAEPAAAEAPPGESAPDLAEHLATTILALLRSQEQGEVTTWSLTLPLHPHPLPDTEVGISLSPHWLSVRFRTSSSESLHRLSRHSGKLRALLVGCVGGHRDIDIDIG